MILFRYLAREVLIAMLAVTFSLMVIIVSSRFVKYLAEVAQGDLAAEVLFQILLYRLPNFLEVIIPMGLFIGILLAYGRLYVDSEMTVMRACGFSRARLIAYTLGPALLIGVLVGWISMYVSPAGIQAYQELLQDSKSSDSLKVAVEGRFRVDRSTGQVTYIERLQREGGVMHGIFLAETQESEDGGPRLELIAAATGQFEVDKASGQRFLALDQGVRYLGRAGELDYQVVRFKRLGQWLEQEGPVSYRQEADGLPTAVLWKSSEPEHVAALQWRISLALLVPIIAVIAIAMSETDHRRGRYGKMFPAFVIYLVYLVALNAGRDALARGTLPAWPGIWWIHAIFAVLAVVLLYGPSWVRRWRAGSLTIGAADAQA